MNAMHRLTEAANTNDYFEIGPEEARELWAAIVRLREGQASDREPRLATLLQRWLDILFDPEYDAEALAKLSGQTKTALLAVRMNAEPTNGRSRMRLDAARYRWLRDGNAYAPEESQVSGYDALDALCDEGIAEVSGVESRHTGVAGIGTR